jgi:aminoglycoside/choline kinase family phosphotransferase
MSWMTIHEIAIRDALRDFYGSLVEAYEIHKLKGDASTRSYYRLRVGRGSQTDLAKDKPGSIIVMQLPEGDVTSDEATSGVVPRELPFLNVQRLLKQRAIPVPAVYLYDRAHRIVLLEDLGDETFEARLKQRDRESWEHLYKQAVTLLAQLHRNCERTDDNCIAYERKYDRYLLRWELDHFREWGVDANYGQMSEVDQELLDRIFERLVSRIEEIPTGFVHRDFQSRNLMWVGRQEDKQLFVIDFQDAMLGPQPYDLAALLCDSYIDLDLDLQETMIDHYLSHAELPLSEARAFPNAFWLVALHRKLKDAGRFVFIDRVRKNPDFLPFYPQSLSYVGRALDKLDGFDGLDVLLKQLVPGFPENVLEPRSVVRRV